MTHQGSKPKQSIQFVSGSGYATVYMYNPAAQYGFASPNRMLQLAGIDQAIFFHVSQYVIASKRWRDEVVYSSAPLPKEYERSLMNMSIFIPAIYRKEDGRVTARQWTTQDNIHPRLQYVVEIKQSGSLFTADSKKVITESVVFVGSSNQCDLFIQHAKDESPNRELEKRGGDESILF